MPKAAGATTFVRTVQYIQIVLDPGETSDSVTLTGAQTAANCVPFASMEGDVDANTFGKLGVDIIVSGSPATVTAQRNVIGGTVTVGVYVVEFLPAYVKVQQGTYTIPNGSAGPASSGITTVSSLTRAAVVSYSRNSSSGGFNHNAIQATFASTSQVRHFRNGTSGQIDGHWYVFEALDNGGFPFSVQTANWNFTTAAGETTFTAVPASSTFTVGSYRSSETSGSPDTAAFKMFLSGCGATCSTVRAESYGNSVSATFNAFIITWSSGLSVQRNTVSWASASLTAGAVVSAVNDLQKAMAWNVLANGPGAMMADSGGGAQLPAAFQRVRLTSTTTVSLQRDFGDDIAESAFEVVDWDAVTTEVALRTFEAEAGDGAVELRWSTASELDNVGFHLYRSTDATGPFERITPDSPIPGLGSSPSGASYRYRDDGLANGVTVYYQLEDIDTSGRTERHGPVEATPLSGLTLDPEGSEPGIITVGKPDTNRFQVLEANESRMVVRLATNAYEAVPHSDGSVSLTVAGFVEDEGAIPKWRSWVALPTKRALDVGSIEESDRSVFPSWIPAADATQELLGSRDGTVRLRTERDPSRVASRVTEPSARVLSIGYQGETPKALLELSPWSWNGKELSLAGTLTVTLEFSGDEFSERRDRRRDHATVRRFITREAGLYEVELADLNPRHGRSMSASDLRLSRLGEEVPFHIEPDDGRFGPGSRLYFVSEGGDANPYGATAVYELEMRAAGRTPMTVEPNLPSGPPLPYYWYRLEREENRYYQPGLVDSEELWLWDMLLAPAHKTYELDVEGLVPDAAPAQLELVLQGGTDSKGHTEPDHHVRVHVNGTYLTETRFDGKTSHRLDVELPVGVLQPGTNRLEIENVGDTGVLYSMILLDRFAVTYPRSPDAESGTLHTGFRDAGVLSLDGFTETPWVVDITDSPRWLGRARHIAARAGHRYLAVPEGAVLRPETIVPPRSVLRNVRQQADYLVIAPAEFLAAAEPLLDQRRRQGLRARSVSFEAISLEFGYGEARPEAVREFVAYAYHHWQRPAPRYVVLLGDGSYDFEDHLGTGVQNRIPPMIVRTSFLWTASDPAYASVNGEDPLPDLAIGRLPAATSEEARVMVEKILTYENGGGSLSGGAPPVLVADNPDVAGDFEADANELAESVLSSLAPRKIFLDALGVEETRLAIRRAFDEGTGLMSYIGHGGIHLWASENVFDVSDVEDLAPQERQPILLALDCLNGYFHFPHSDSLAESLVKAEGRGAIAAFSPTGLSLDGPAHLFHGFLLEEILSPRHHRLGDAVLAAQEAYAGTGAFPELLRIYHLLGDPALRLR